MTNKCELEEIARNTLAAYTEAHRSFLGENLMEGIKGLIDPSALRRARDAIKSLSQPLPQFPFVGLQDISRAMSREMATISKAIQTAIPQALLQTIEQMARRHEKTDREFAAIITRAKWPMVWHIPARATDEIVLEYNKGTLPWNRFRAELDKLLVAYHDEKLIKEIVSDWHDIGFVKRRTMILRDAVDAHIKGLYTLSIPVFLISIEGLIADALGIGRQIKTKRLKRSLECRKYGQRKSRMHKAGMRYVRHRIYQSWFRGDPIPDQPNRHAILHGQDTAYPDEVMSLKAVLAVDNVIRHFSSVG